MAACLLFACEPDLNVGSWKCPWPSRIPDGGDSVGLTPYTGPVRVPWSTSFETDMCDYDREQGFCYASPNSSFGFIDAPAHSGRRAMAFSVSLGSTAFEQARCVREGAMPVHGMYTAWFLLPSNVTNSGTWSLVHFRGGDSDGTNLTALWDVDVSNNADNGSSYLYVYDQRRWLSITPPEKVPVPTGKWFKLDVRWRQAADESAEIELLQDGRSVLVIEGASDSFKWRQWYVGNWANSLSPRSNIVYVDDVAIRSLP
ncbi:MAG TPA: hypothetical protein VFQ35_09765 [Polyangiaceae bacterium]|nr:hypothetical protein [Polyangiaceae bacterium]